VGRGSVDEGRQNIRITKRRGNKYGEREMMYLDFSNISSPIFGLQSVHNEANCFREEVIYCDINVKLFLVWRKH